MARSKLIFMLMNQRQWPLVGAIHFPLTSRQSNYYNCSLTTKGPGLRTKKQKKKTACKEKTYTHQYSFNSHAETFFLFDFQKDHI